MSVKLLFPLLLEPDDVAARFNVKKRTIFRWVKQGKLKAFRDGHIVRIYADSVQAALAHGRLVQPRGGASA